MITQCIVIARAGMRSLQLAHEGVEGRVIFLNPQFEIHVACVALQLRRPTSHAYDTYYYIRRNRASRSRFKVVLEDSVQPYGVTGRSGSSIGLVTGMHAPRSVLCHTGPGSVVATTEEVVTEMSNLLHSAPDSVAASADTRGQFSAAALMPDENTIKFPMPDQGWVLTQFPRLVHRPDVDGLRALAVVPVVLYHFDLGCPGGFAGVDIFFMISGFLITSIILGKLDTQSFSLGDFWMRRCRRAMLQPCLDC